MLIAVLLATITVAVFRPVVSHGFLNWDDPAAFSDNTELAQPVPARIAWAFTTTRLAHYQPLSWLTMAWAAGTPPDPARVHAVAVALHAVNVAGLFGLLLMLAGIGGTTWRAAVSGAAAAALLFAVHPLRVEPVAWASALPYLLSAAGLVATTAAWIRWLRRGGAGWLAASTGLFLLSQLSRVTAPLFPIVLAFIAMADPGARRLAPRAVLAALLPMAAAALSLGAVEAAVREVESLADVGVAARLAAVAANPAVYLGRTLWPVDLSPLDVWPRHPGADWRGAALGVTAFAVVVAATWRSAGGRRTLALWGTWLVLFLPVLGLTPSGLQATADRYTYAPAMALSAAVAMALASARPVWRSIALMAGAAVLLPLLLLTRGQIDHWRDSVSLWSRSAALDPDNDVALYNLALALDAAGRGDEAIATLQRLVAMVPDHDLAQRALATRLAARDLAAGDAAADAGRLAEAVTAYDRALLHAPDLAVARTHRGMAWMQRGNAEQAAADLEPAVRSGSADLQVTGALALAWAATGRVVDAIRLLEDAAARAPEDTAITGNLARLLVTAEPPELRDPSRALALAARLNDATGGRDPRVLDTLALALAGTGRKDQAAKAWDVAITGADEAGDAALAVELRRHREMLRR